MIAAQDWMEAKPKVLPRMHIGVLVRTPGPVYDVACYIGKDAGGNDRWIMSDISLDPKTITHWAYINEPENAV